MDPRYRVPISTNVAHDLAQVIAHVESSASNVDALFSWDTGLGDHVALRVGPTSVIVCHPSLCDDDVPTWTILPCVDVYQNDTDYAAALYLDATTNTSDVAARALALVLDFAARRAAQTEERS